MTARSLAVSPSRPLTPSMEALLARANLLRMRGHWAEAVDRCTEALRLDPHSAAAHSLLGDIYENQGRLDKAIHWYQLSLEQNPESLADTAKLARARELQAVRRRTGPARLSWAYLVAVAGVAFLFVAFAMAAIVAGERGKVTTNLNATPLPQYPPHVTAVKPPDHTTEEDAVREALAAVLGSQFMYVTAVQLNPVEREATVTVRIDDHAITPDPMGGGRQGRILREGYRIADLLRQELQKQQWDLRFVTIRALSKLSSGSGDGPTALLWQGRVDVTRVGVRDDQASADEVRNVFDPRRMYWNPIAAF